MAQGLAAPDRLLTASVATLRAAGLVEPTRVARDGMRAGRERAARDRREGVAAALEHLLEREATQPPAEAQATARASTTDPEARAMELAAGGFASRRLSSTAQVELGATAEGERS